ncbi:FAD-dependent monooxygenase [Streptomyces sp. NPDC006368]|uniref:NAD(P)/FAD-dependent oxidoreductase n=1 Tax=Streptomyces sp. NPDC006368 TaxID=3156760 RepID=UPI0033AFF433
MSRTRKHAIVLGAGMAGLFAARVLSESYETVTLVDRDDVRASAGPRRGVPQGHHVHGLLARGQQIIEELFPGITAELAAHGAAKGDVVGDVRWYMRGERLKPARSGLVALTSSRPFLERHVRGRVAALRNVSFLERHHIEGLIHDEHRPRVHGVRLRPENEEGSHRDLEGDLVVDATGRGSRTPAWLEQLGYPRVDEARHPIGLGYTTAHFRLRSDPYQGGMALNAVASPELPRGVILSEVDGGRTVVTAYGILGDHPPTDREGLLTFVKSLGVAGVHEALTEAELLHEPVGYRFPANLRRFYEHTSALPDGLLVIGDAVCSFNPSYAQGMTVAALSALTLRSHLDNGGDGTAEDPLTFFRTLAADVLDGAWAMSIGGDLAFPGVRGERTAETLATHQHLARVQRAAVHDGDIATALIRVFGLVDAPTALTHPDFLRALERAEA